MTNRSAGHADPTQSHEALHSTARLVFYVSAASCTSATGKVRRMVKNPLTQLSVRLLLKPQLWGGRVPTTAPHTLQEPNSSRHVAAVASSAGNEHSMRNSSSVTSCGVPNVVKVEKNRSSTSPFRKVVVSSGVVGTPISRVRHRAGTPG